MKTDPEDELVERYYCAQCGNEMPYDVDIIICPKVNTGGEIETLFFCNMECYESFKASTKTYMHTPPPDVMEARHEEMPLDKET